MPAPDLQSETALGMFANAWIFSRNQHATFTYPNWHLPFPPNPSPAANALRCKQSVAAWHAMSIAQRRSWRTIARRQRVTPYLAFMTTNLKRYYTGQPLITTP